MSATGELYTILVSSEQTGGRYASWRAPARSWICRSAACTQSGTNRSLPTRPPPPNWFRRATGVSPILTMYTAKPMS